MTDALQKEAREAARSAQSFASVCVVSGSPRRADGKRSLVRIGYEQGYLAGLGARKKEIEELRAKMEAQPPSAKIERASRYEPCAECGFLLYRGKPAMHNCNKSLVIEAKDAEIASLRAKIEAMERQEPVATVRINAINGNPSVDFVPGHHYLHHNDRLYLAPGAQPALIEQDTSVRKAWARFSNELPINLPSRRLWFCRNERQKFNARRWFQ